MEEMDNPIESVDETPVWTGGPSQAVHFWTYVVCALLCVLVVPIFLAAWKYVVTRCTVFELTTERLLITTGVLSRSTDQFELYRVKDIRYPEPFLKRLFGLGTITLITSDKSNPELVLPAIVDGKTVKELIRRNVELCRDRKRTREIDFQ
jgi:uncharacterized membrane protein YdbT with pleckstrin-like domain